MNIFQSIKLWFFRNSRLYGHKLVIPEADWDAKFGSMIYHEFKRHKNGYKVKWCHSDYINEWLIETNAEYKALITMDLSRGQHAPTRFDVVILFLDSTPAIEFKMRFL